MSSPECCADTVGGGLLRRPEVEEVRRIGFAAVRSGAAYRVSDLSSSTGMPTTAVRAIVKELLEAGLVTVDGTMDTDPLVDGVDGLTIRATRHQLDLGGTSLHTWCGFDTIGIPAALGVDANVVTWCPGCDAVIMLEIQGGEPLATSVVGWWPYRVEGPVKETFCPTASLFCNREHLVAWRNGTNGPGEAVPVAELAVRGRATWALFADRPEHA